MLSGPFVLTEPVLAEVRLRRLARLYGTGRTSPAWVADAT